MSRTLSLSALAVLGVAWAGPVSAQQASGPVFVPVDMTACNYREGKGPADLDAAVKAWNAYVDGGENPDVYSGWTLTTHYGGPEQDWDVLWLGAWKNAKFMGAGWDNYFETGGAVQAGFAEVFECRPWNNFASIRQRPTKNNDTPSDGVLMIANCSRKDGVTNADVGAAQQAWSAVLDEHGLEAGIYDWYPVFGGGTAEYHFKDVYAFPSHAALGAYYEAVGNGGLYQKSEEIFGDVMTCDVARVYNVQNRRFAELRK